MRLTPVAVPPVFDGRVSEAEYGAPSIEIPRPGGVIRLWLRRDSAFVYVAAWIPDSSVAWSDALLLSLDTGGDRSPGPMHDDFQWEFRRVLDSSVVFRGDGGRWRVPRDDPDWRLGAGREGGGWEVRSASDAVGWSVEFRVDPYYLSQAPGRLPGLALRIHDDDPQAWYIWPAAPGLRQPTELERRPGLWAAVSP